MEIVVNDSKKLLTSAYWGRSQEERTQREVPGNDIASSRGLATAEWADIAVVVAVEGGFDVVQKTAPLYGKRPLGGAILPGCTVPGTAALRRAA